MVGVVDRMQAFRAMRNREPATSEFSSIDAHVDQRAVLVAPLGVAVVEEPKKKKKESRKISFSDQQRQPPPVVPPGLANDSWIEARIAESQQVREALLRQAEEARQARFGAGRYVRSQTVLLPKLTMYTTSVSCLSCNFTMTCKSKKRLSRGSWQN